MQKQNVTGDSQEITQPSTNPAHEGLDCEFGWDRSVSQGYERSTTLAATH